MAEITDFPAPSVPPEFLFAYHEMDRVEIEGRIIPRLRGMRHGDLVTLEVDGRFCVDFPTDIARQAAWLVAQALAVGAGYPHLGATSKDMPFAAIATELVP
jgi:hypothetical protein